MDFRKKLFLMNLLFLSSIATARNLTICNPDKRNYLVVEFPNLKKVIIEPDKNKTINNISEDALELYVVKETNPLGEDNQRGENIMYLINIKSGKKDLTISCKDLIEHPDIVFSRVGDSIYIESSRAW